MMESIKSLHRTHHSISHLGLKKVSMFLLALLPLLSWYKIPFPVGLGYALLLPLSVYAIFINKFNINVIPASFWIIFIYVSSIWIYNHDFELWTLFPPGGWVFFIFTLALIWGVITFDLRLLKKCMRWTVIISGILFWIQFLLFITTGSQQFCFVPNLTGEFTYEDLTYSEVVSRHLNSEFPCSIFLEKSYLAYYFLTYLTVIWFDKKNGYKLWNKEIIFVIATLIASRSGTALVGLSVLIIVRLFIAYRKGSSHQRMIIIALMVPLVVGAGYVYVSSEMGGEMLERSDELSTEGTSGFERVVSGYLMFDTLSLEEQMIGIPDVRYRFSYETFSGKAIFYVNGVQSILLNLGYVGLFLYLIFYINVYLKSDLTSRMCIIILLLMGLSEANYLNPYMMLLTIIPCANIYNNKRKDTIIQNYTNPYEKNTACFRDSAGSHQDGATCKRVSETYR